jgi:hypothetical protein
MPLLSIAVAAFAVEIPFFFFGMPSGHDLEFHLYSWLEVLSQWKHGVFYPRWAALAHFGYGEPRFIFYPPASWTLGAALASVFPWTVVPALYLWLALFGAGASMFLLARRWLDRRQATFAAVLYAVNPYHLVVVYWRSAFAELLAGALLPLLVLLLLRPQGNRRRAIISIAFVLAASWLINAPSAVMIHYSLALLMGVIAWRRRSGRIFLTGLAAIPLGAALASFYLLPAVYEQKWVTIAEAVSTGLRPVDSFLFTHTADPEHDAFNHLVSSVAVVEILLTGLAAWAARNWRSRRPELWYSLVAWAAMCVLLMLPISNVLWIFLPKLRFMQFPWRFLLCLGVPFALLTSLGIRNRAAQIWSARTVTLRIVLYAVVVSVIFFAGRPFQPPWWDHAADLREMQEFMANATGYEGTDEYTPVGSNPSAIDKEARRVTVAGPAHAAIRVSEWTPEHKVFTAEMSEPDTLVLHLFNYPAWRVEVNGKRLPPGSSPESSNDLGQMTIPVDPGANRVEIAFVRTWDRSAGAWITLAAILLALFLWRAEGEKRPE